MIKQTKHRIINGDSRQMNELNFRKLNIMLIFNKIAAY